MPKVQYESAYTRTINDIISLMSQTAEGHESLTQDATVYFATAARKKQTLQSLHEKIATAKQANSDELPTLERSLKTELAEQTAQRQARLTKAVTMCERILDASEGHDYDETLEKSAKYLGTFLLLSPGEGKRLPHIHQNYKPAYKAVLSVRLLDELMRQETVKNKYLLANYNLTMRYTKDDTSEQKTTVLYPLMLVALFQDIGMQHPDAQTILKGKDGDQDPFRVLEQAERRALLKLTFQHSLDYLEFGLGTQKYIGNSKTEREEFDQQQAQALSFMKTIMRDILKPKYGLGELIKIPQIYTSVILSTKRDYKIVDLPKACVLIQQMAEKGSINKLLTGYFCQLVGHFPQGFGIAYIPINDQGYEIDRYEYAVVIGLHPKDSYEPSCRLVTRNLTFISSGQTLTLKRDSNLYFPKARKKLSKIDHEKLKSILANLKQHVDSETIESLIPKCWHPHEFFSLKEHQNIWRKST